MADFVPNIPQRRAQPDIYSALLAASVILLVAGSVWLALKNTDMTSGGSMQGGPFEFLSK